VEESAAAAESLREQSARMAEAISVFKLSGAAQRAPAPRAPALPKPAPAPAKPAIKAAAPKPAAAPAPKAAPVAAPRPAAAPAPAADDGDWETF